MATAFERWARHWIRSTNPPDALILAMSSTDLPLFQSEGSVRVSGRYLRTSLFLIAVSSALALTSSLVNCLGISRWPLWQVSQQPCCANNGTLPSSIMMVIRSSYMPGCAPSWTTLSSGSIRAVQARDADRAAARAVAPSTGAINRFWSAVNIWLSHTARRRVYYRCLRGAGAFAAGRESALEARNEKRVHALELLRRPLANGFVAGLRLCSPAEFVRRSTAAPGTLRHGGVRNSEAWKIDPARSLKPSAAISQTIRARRDPSPRARAVRRLGDCLRSALRRRAVGAARDVAMRARAARAPAALRPAAARRAPTS